MKVFIGAYRYSGKDDEPIVFNGNGGAQLQEFNVENIVIHPGWGNNPNSKDDNDFALLFLNTSDGVARAKPVEIDYKNISDNYSGKCQ